MERTIRRLFDKGQGQVRLKHVPHRHRPRARAAATMRCAEGLVQIQMHHVHAEIRWARHAHERVHVGPVHIHETAPRMHQLGDLPDL